MCLLTYERNKTYKLGFSFGHLGHTPGFGTWRFCGVKKTNFLNMVMWYITLKEMSSRPGYTEKFYHRIKLVTLDGAKGSNTIRSLRERGICDWAPSNVFKVVLLYYP